MKMIKKILLFDEKISFQMLKFYKHHIFNEIMKFISSCGDFGMSWLVIILLTNIYTPTRIMSIHMLIALIASTLLGQITIKTIVKRKRPCQKYPRNDLLVPIPSDASFPSGHTMSSFACSTVMMFYYPEFGIIGIVYAILTAFSRLYLFVHYVSDVVVGTVLGILVGIFCVMCI